MNKATDLWDKLTAVIESTVCDFECLEPIIKEIRAVFPIESKIRKRASLILLAGNDFDMIDVDNLRYLIHEFIKGERRYDVWAGNPEGIPEDETCCIESVVDYSGWHTYQCSRKRGYGPNGDYCKQHAKMLMDRATPV